MRYNKFIIKNFKGIRELVIDLNRPPRSNIFTLVGLNESGKTTILEAMHWLSNPKNYDLISLIPKNKLLNFNGEISVSAEIELSEDEEQVIAGLLYDKHNKFKITEPINRIYISRKYHYTDSNIVNREYSFNTKIIGKTKRMKAPKILKEYEERYKVANDYILNNLLPSIIYYENFLFNFPDKLYLATLENQQMNNRDFFYKDVIQDVMNSMEMDLNVDKHLTERAKSGLSPDLRSMGSTLDKLGSKITTEVFIAWRELLKFSGTSLSITLGQTLEKDEKGYYIKVQVKEGDQTYLIRERSLGFRWFFSFILFTHFRAYREKQKRNALFLLDEPASNLHQTAQSKILSIFKKFPSNQDIIYATHSHHMIDTKWLAATFVVKNEAKEYSDLDVAYNSNMTNITLERYFQFVAKYPKDTDYYRPILDALDYQPSQLELTPELIMLEGKYDFYILKYMYEMEFVKSTICKYLYPGTGKDKLEYIIGLYIGWGKNFVVLLDDDRGGRDTYQRLFKIFGNIIKNRLFTLSEINKDWSGYEMEDTFIKADQSKVINTIYPGNVYFDKNKFNTALQDSLLNNRIIKLQQHTINRFKKIFSFLEKKLDENRNGIKA